jgi:hypothetical protein
MQCPCHILFARPTSKRCGSQKHHQFMQFATHIYDNSITLRQFMILGMIWNRKVFEVECKSRCKCGLKRKSPEVCRGTVHEFCLKNKEIIQKRVSENPNHSFEYEFVRLFMLEMYEFFKSNPDKIPTNLPYFAL